MKGSIIPLVEQQESELGLFEDCTEAIEQVVMLGHTYPWEGDDALFANEKQVQ